MTPSLNCCSLLSLSLKSTNPTILLHLQYEIMFSKYPSLQSKSPLLKVVSHHSTESLYLPSISKYKRYTRYLSLNSIIT
ncbi:hypothetical protein CW304_30905 [Bacillus sp. UFRGS-B20]|nr:hypothetical protein CW304_30905 [Bacillus sp. UFRGS-B20]